MKHIQLCLFHQQVQTTSALLQIAVSCSSQMQLPGLGRMMNFQVGPHTEEVSRLDTYMSRCSFSKVTTPCFHV